MRDTSYATAARKLQMASDLLRAVSHPLRLKILEFIDERKTINVNRIYIALKLEQSITSHHLRILRKANLVITERDGKFIFYKVNYSQIEKVSWALEGFSNK